MLLGKHLLLAALAASGPAAADPGQPDKPVQVEFDAPAGCSSAETFFRSLRLRTDSVREARGGEPHTTIQVRLTRTRGRVLGELRVVDDRGGTDTRKVQGASCDDVVQALSLTAALAVDPSALLSAPATAPAEQDSPSSTADSNVPAPIPNEPAADKRARVDAHGVTKPMVTEPATDTVPEFEFGVGAVGTTLLTHGASPGIEVYARYALAGSGPLRTTLGLGLAHLQNDAVQSPGAVQVSLTSVSATLCTLRARSGIFAFEPCALMEVGQFAASGRQADHTYDVVHLWLGAGAILHTSAALGRGLSLDLDGGLNVPFFKRRFYATSTDNIVGESPTISPTLKLGLSYGF